MIDWDEIGDTVAIAVRNVSRRLERLLCALGAHRWQRMRRGHKFYCSRYWCKASRGWRKSDK